MPVRPLLLCLCALLAAVPGTRAAAQSSGAPSAPVSAARPAGARAVTAGRLETGALEAGDARLDDDSRYDDFIYMARAGEQIQVRLSSDAFDPYLYVGRRGAGTPLLDVVSDDDSGGGTTAQVTYTARAAGPVIIRANSLLAGQTGRYTLRVLSGQ
jgi:hypothetical protein